MQWTSSFFTYFWYFELPLFLNFNPTTISNLFMLHYIFISICMAWYVEGQSHFFLTFHSDKTLTPPFPKSLFSQVILSLHSYWIIIVASETVYWHWRIWGVPSVRHTMYRQAAITWVVFLPCVILLLTAILKKLKAVSIQCWFNFNWTPNCWILFLPKIDKYLRYLISINLRKRDREREGNRYSKWSYIFIHGSFC